MSSPTTGPQALARPDPFCFGWRYVRRSKPDGKEEFDMVPLTLEDVLHPQEDDHIRHDSLHDRLRRYLQNVFEWRVSQRPNLLSLSNCLVDWDLQDLLPHCPDLIVFERDNPWTRRNWSTFHVGREGARPLAVIEITSPATRVHDLGPKVGHYHRARVPVSAVVDREQEEGPFRLLGHRWHAGGYEALPLDGEGRLPLPPVDVLLELVADRLSIVDATTGERFMDYAAVSAALEAATRARQFAEGRAPGDSQMCARIEACIKELRTELARLRGPAA